MGEDLAFEYRFLADAPEGICGAYPNTTTFGATSTKEHELGASYVMNGIGDTCADPTPRRGS